MRLRFLPFLRLFRFEVALLGMIDNCDMQRMRSDSDSSLLQDEILKVMVSILGDVFETRVCVSLYFVLFSLRSGVVTTVILMRQCGLLISFRITSLGSASLCFVLFSSRFVHAIAVMRFLTCAWAEGLFFWTCHSIDIVSVISCLVQDEASHASCLTCFDRVPVASGQE
jgi:hypothetical protein